MCGRKTLHLQPHRRPSKPQHQTRQNGERKGRDRRSVRAMEFTPVLPVPIYPVPCVCVAAYYQQSHFDPNRKKWTQCDRRLRGLKKENLQRRLIAIVGEPPEKKPGHRVLEGNTFTRKTPKKEANQLPEHGPSSHGSSATN